MKFSLCFVVRHVHLILRIFKDKYSDDDIVLVEDTDEDSENNDESDDEFNIQSLMPCKQNTVITVIQWNSKNGRKVLTWWESLFCSGCQIEQQPKPG